MVSDNDLKYQAKVLSDKLRAICEEAINVQIVKIADEHKEQVFVRANYKLSRTVMPRQVEILLRHNSFSFTGLEITLKSMIEASIMEHNLRVKEADNFYETYTRDGKKDR